MLMIFNVALLIFYENLQCKANSLMPVKRCGPLKLVKRKKENDPHKNDENCYSSPTKKVKSLNIEKVVYHI